MLIRGTNPFVFCTNFRSKSTRASHSSQNFIPAPIQPIGPTNVRFRTKLQKENFLRLDKLLSNIGIVSRRDAVDFVKKNEVSVVIGTDISYDASGNKVETERLQRVQAATIVYPKAVRLNGKPLNYVETVSILMHKPRGYVCSHARDEPESKLIFDLLPQQIMTLKPKLSVAGRLDKWASGLVVLSQDGLLVNNIIHELKIPKTYRVDLKHDLKGGEDEQFRSGEITLRSESKPCLPAKLEVVNPKQVLITLQEGKYHQIRRMIASVGNLSLGVHREKIGDLELGDMTPGAWRNLTSAELEHLNTNKPLKDCSEKYTLPKKPKKSSVPDVKRRAAKNKQKAAEAASEEKAKGGASKKNKKGTFNKNAKTASKKPATPGGDSLPDPDQMSSKERSEMLRALLKGVDPTLKNRTSKSKKSSPRRVLPDEPQLDFD